MTVYSPGNHFSLGSVRQKEAWQAAYVMSTPDPHFGEMRRDLAVVSKDQSMQVNEKKHEARVGGRQ